jgi:heme exporter protein C
MSETAAARPARWIDLANPTRFIALADRLVPWLAALSLLVLAAGLWLAFTAPSRGWP